MRIDKQKINKNTQNVMYKDSFFNERRCICMVQLKCSRISRENKNNRKEVIYSKDNNKFPELKRQVVQIEKVN